MNDVAWLFRSLEDEAVEHTFALYKFKDDSYLVQTSFDRRNYFHRCGFTVVDGKRLQNAAQSITLVDNHPSGQLISSKHDRLMLQRLHEIFYHTGIKVEDGIVINLRSGKYLVFNGELGSYRVSGTFRAKSTAGKSQHLFL